MFCSVVSGSSRANPLVIEDDVEVEEGSFRSPVGSSPVKPVAHRRESFRLIHVYSTPL